MTFEELKIIIEKNFGTKRPADIAKELEVSPQVVSNWKSRNQVPYKYVKKIRKKIEDINNSQAKQKVESIIYTGNNPVYNGQNDEEGTITKTILIIFRKIIDDIKIVFAVPIIFLIIAILYNRYSDRVFITYVNILPVTESKGMGLPSIAQQFGFEQAAGGASGLHATQMYPDIIKSKRLARMVLKHKFDTKKFGKGRSLVGILLERDTDIEWQDRDIKRAVSRLGRKIGVRKNRGSALLTLSFSTFEPEFSADLAEKVLDEFKVLLTSFKLNDILEKKRYIENRIKRIQSDLSAAEEKLKEFREKNRNIDSSPGLTLVEERLMREVDVQKEIFITLKSQYEMVQIELLGEKSMVQVLDPPESPLVMTKPNKKRNRNFAIILGIISSLSLIFAKDWYFENKEDLKLF